MPTVHWNIGTECFWITPNYIIPGYTVRGGVVSAVVIRKDGSKMFEVYTGAFRTENELYITQDAAEAAALEAAQHVA